MDTWVSSAILRSSFRTTGSLVSGRFSATSSGRPSSDYRPNCSSADSIVLSNLTAAPGSSLGPSLPIQASATPKQRLSKLKPYFCPYHEELGLQHDGFGKKGDCKDHLRSFHNLGKEWSCCFETFDREQDVINHRRLRHAGTPDQQLTVEPTELLPKEWSACGFRGCQDLFSDWNDWVDHITNHMRDGKQRADWSYNVKVQNLLRQSDLHSQWQNLLQCKYGTCDAPDWLEWRPRSARQLVQKLERRDFRPGILLLLQAALDLGYADQRSQVLLSTPSVASLLIEGRMEDRDRILMRPSTTPTHTYSTAENQLPYPSTLQGDRPPSTPDREGISERSNFENMDFRPFHNVSEIFVSDPDNIESSEDWSSAIFDRGVSQQQEAGKEFSSEVAQGLHALEQFKYYDYRGFAREQFGMVVPLPPLSSPAGGLRRVFSSASLTDRRSQSSMESEERHADANPVPVTPAVAFPIPGRPRSCSERSRLSE
jgi:hypothetical protein